MSLVETAAGQDLYRRAKRLIPGGTQLLSKRPEMFLPEAWPSYAASARGVEVVDLDGRRYIDMSIMGVGACVFGYADPEIDAAAKAAIDAGVMCTLNAPEEVELAEELVRLHPWSDAVRFTRSGGEALAVAVRIARAHTRRDVVAICGYHGWSDWYLAANLGDDDSLDGHLMPGLSPAGVPRGLAGTALPFHYNRLSELERIVAEHGSELAAVVIEPQRGDDPAPGFLEGVRALASETGAVLVFDEVTTGFRFVTGGIHLRLPVAPDLAVLAKAMANGYAIAAVLGRAEVMDAAQGTFISSTNWTERIGPAAALAAIRKHEREHAGDRLVAIGSRVVEGWRAAASAGGVEIDAEGTSLAHFSFAGDDDLALGTLFTQRMLERGYLAWTQFKPSLAHGEEHIAPYLDAVADVFVEIAEARERGDVHDRLTGPTARRGFYRLAR